MKMKMMNKILKFLKNFFFPKTFIFNYIWLYIAIISLSVVLIILYTDFIIPNAYAEGLTDEMDRGEIERTPLPQDFRTNNPGRHRVTGGIVETFPDTLGRSRYYINGIFPIDTINQLANGYNIQGANQPFSRNLAMTLYELKAAGITQLHVRNTGGPLMDYIQTFKENALSSNNAARTQVNISKLLINGLGRA